MALPFSDVKATGQTQPRSVSCCLFFAFMKFDYSWYLKAYSDIIACASYIGFRKQYTLIMGDIHR